MLSLFQRFAIRHPTAQCRGPVLKFQHIAVHSINTAAVVLYYVTYLEGGDLSFLMLVEILESAAFILHSCLVLSCLPSAFLRVSGQTQYTTLSAPELLVPSLPGASPVIHSHVRISNFTPHQPHFLYLLNRPISFCLPLPRFLLQSVPFPL